MTVFSWIAMVLLATAPQQSAADASVQLNITVRSYRADGTLGGSAGGSLNEAVPNYAWVDMTTCSVGSGSWRSSSPTAIVWQYTGRIVEHTGSVYVVEISGHRMDATASEASPRTMTLTLGGPVVLDEVTGQSGCGMRSARLEVSVATAREMSVGAGGGAEGGRSVSGVGIGRAGAGGGGSGVTTAAALVRTAAAGDSAVVDFSGNGASPASAGSVRTVLRSMPAASYDVEVWLVHTTADGPPETWHLSGHLDPLGQVMEFSPVAVQTTHGVSTVTVAAMLRPMITADGLTVLRATIARVLSVSGGEGFGVTDKVIPMPGPADVVSFEMPSHGTSPDPIVQFSLRVRITPGRPPDDVPTPFTRGSVLVSPLKS